MDRVIVRSQSDLDTLPERFEQYTVIEIRVPERTRISITKAWDNSSVVAWDNSSVVARSNSRVEAWGASVCRVFSSGARVELHGHAVALLQSDGTSALRKSDTATILQVPPPEWTVEDWIEREGITECDGRVVLYKRVSQDWKTQEGQPWETCWQPGTSLTHPVWQPDDHECGAGKFHACSRPYFCDEFRQGKNDRYVAIAVRREDMHAWRQPWYPHKIAVRAAEVLYECDRFGRRTS